MQTNLHPISLVSEPATKVSILDAFAWLRREGARAWGEISPDVFAAPLGDAWSPADNVRHLVKSNGPVATALRIPRAGVKLMFGTAKAPSRTYGGLVADYRQVLAGGADAGKYAPSPTAPAADPAAWQVELLGKLDQSLADVASAVARWDEPSLDECRLPHPLLGKLTVREMLLFTIYHNLHHAGNVGRRLADVP